MCEVPRYVRWERKSSITDDYRILFKAAGGWSCHLQRWGRLGKNRSGGIKDFSLGPDTFERLLDTQVELSGLEKYNFGSCQHIGEYGSCESG